MNAVRLMRWLRRRVDAVPSDVAAALQQHRAPQRVALVSMFDECLPPAVTQRGR